MRYALCALLFVVAVPLTAATFTSSTTGNWSSASTWGAAGVPGAGDTAVISSGTIVTLDVSATVATLTINGGTLTGSQGITITSAFNFNGGTLSGSGSTSIPSGASISVGGYSIIDARPVLNAATMTISSSYYLYLENNAVLTNSGTIVFAGDGDIFLNSSLGTTAIVNNGTIEKSGGSATSQINVPIVANSGSSVAALSATLLISASVTASGATFSASSGATLEFASNATCTFDASSTITGAGTIEWLNGTNTVSGAYTVTGATQNSATTTIAVSAATTTGAVTTTGGTLTFNGASTLTVPTLTLSGGTLTGSAPISLSGSAMTWSSGTISGSGSLTIAAVTTLTLSGTVVLDTRAVTLGGTIDITSNATLYFANNATLTSNGTIDMQSDGNLVLYTSVGSIDIINNGTIKKSAGTLTTQINVPITLNSGSQLLIQSGTVYLGAITASSATLDVSSGATANFNTGDTRTFDAASTISGSGTLNWAAGTNTVNGNYNLGSSATTQNSGGTTTLNNISSAGSTVSASGGTLTLNSASTLSITTLTMLGGTIAGNAPIQVTGASQTWTGGTIGGTGAFTVPAGTTVTLNGTTFIDTRAVTSFGTLAVTNNASLYLGNNAVFTNNGTINFQSDGNIFLYTAVGSVLLINNGTIEKTAGSVNTQINVPLVMNSGSQLTASTTIYLAGVTSSGGTFSVPAGATLIFNTGDTRTFDALSSISGAGTVEWSGGTNTVNGNYNVTGTTYQNGATATTMNNITSIGSALVVSSGTMTLNSGSTISLQTLTMNAGVVTGTAPITVTGASMTWSSGTIAGSGAFTIPAGTTVSVVNPVLDTRAFTNNGTIALTSNSALYLANNALLTNNGTIDIQSDSSVQPYAAIGSMAIVNNGVIKKSAGSGATFFYVPLTASSGSQFNVQSGNVYIATVTATGAQFNISLGAALVANTGDTRTFDAASSISGNGTMEWAGGTNTVNAAYSVSGTTKSSGATTTISNLASIADVVVTGGTLTLNSASTVSIPTLTMNGGVLAGNAPISLTGASMSWTSGTITGSGSLTIPAGTTITLSSMVFDSRAFTNNGAMNFTVAAGVYFENNATLANNGTIDFQADVSFYLGTAVGSIAVTNNGTFKKSAGTSASAIDLPLIATTGSQFLLQSGTVYLDAVTSTGATFNLGSGTTFDFIYSGNRTFDSATTITGSGTIESQGGTTTIACAFGNPVTMTGGTLTLNSATTLTLPTLTFTSGGTLNGSANITIAGASTWNSGTMGGTGTTTIPAGTVITTNTAVFDGRAVTNNGTINVNSTSALYLENNAVLTNNGTIDLQGDGGVYLNSAVGSTALVNNSIFRKSSGTGASQITVPLTLNSGSQLNVQSGTLYLYALTASGAAFNIANGATLLFYSGDTRTIDSSSTISGSGTTVIQGGTTTFTGTITTILQMSGGTLHLNSAATQTIPTLTIQGGTLDGTANINVTAAAMSWAYGTIGGSGTLTIPAGTVVSIVAYLTLDTRPIINNGTIDVTTANSITWTNGATLTNNGIFDVQADAPLSASSGTLINNSVLKKSAGTGSPSWTVAITENSGSQFQLQSGNLYVGVINSTGGTTTVGSGCQLIFYYGGTSSFDSTSTIGGAGTIDAQGGTTNVAGTITTPLAVIGGTFNINSTAAQTIPSLTITSGTFGGTGSVTIGTGSASWGSAIIAGTGTLTIPSGASISVISYMTFDAHQIVNNGTMIFPTANNMTMQNNAVLTNNGTIDLQSDGGFYLGGVAGSTAIVNAATLKKSGGTGSATFNVPLTLQSGAQYLLQSGNIYQYAMTSSGATTTVASGSILYLYSSDVRTFDSSSTVGGSGSVTVTGGTNTFSGTWTAPLTMQSGTLTINSATAQTLNPLAMQGGTLNGTAAIALAGPATWSGGTIGGTGALTVNSGVTLSLTGSGFLDGRPMTVNGTLAIINYGATLYLENNASVTNNGTIDSQNDNSIYLYIGSASVTNNGTFGKSCCGGTSTVNVPFTNNAAATIKAASGSLSFSNLTNAGTLYFPVGGNTSTTFGNMAVSGAFPLAGTLTVTTVNGYAPSTGTAFQILTYGSYSGSFANKNLDYAGGTFTETYAPTALTVTAGPQALGITGIGPVTGTSAGGTTVTITGVDFQSGATVTFGGTAATSVTFNNSTSLTAVTPAHAVGPVDVVVTNPTTQTATLSNGFLFTGLVSHYTFDVNGTPGKDVVSSNDATNVVGVTEVAGGKVGQAGSFSSGYMDLPSATNLNMLRSSDFTLDAWVNSSATTNGNWFTKATASAQQYGLSTSSSTHATFSFDGGAGGTVTSTSPVFDGTWHHVAAVKRGAVAEIWVDGQLQASANVTGSSDSGTFAIGREGACCDTFNGLIDEAKIYNYALPSSGIRTDANTPDLAISKSGPGSVTVGQTITWTITVTNNGPVAATGVTVIDALPSGTSYVSATPSQGTCSNGGNVTCSLGSLGIGSTATITLVANAVAASSVTNTATVSGNETDPVSTNNSSSFTTAINPASCATPTVTAGSATTFCQGGSVTLTANAGGASGYQWNFNANPIPGATGVTYSAAASGDYSVTATFPNACSATSAAVTVTMNANPPTPAITAGGPTTFCQGGSVTLTAPAGYTYSWSNGAMTQSITVTTSGNYSVTVINANGCTATSGAMTVTANPLPNTTIAAPSSACPNSGTSASAPANAGASFSWSATNATITGGQGSNVLNFTPTGAGNVTLTVSITDSNGCSAGSAPVTVTVGSFTPAITASGPATFCQGGSVTLTATAGTSYLWSTGATTQSIVATTSGNFSVTVSSGSCSGTSSPFSVTVNPLPNATITAPASACANAGTSASAPFASGATYNWTATNAAITSGNGTNAIVFTPNGSGSISLNVTVQDANGCIANGSATVAVGSIAPAISASGPATFCHGGSVTLTATAGASYLWSTGATTQSITVTSSGNYTVTVSSGSCSGTSAPFSVTVNPTPSATIGASGPTAFCQGGSVTLTASPAAGWQWSNGATTQSINVTTSGSFTVTVTDTHGCSATSAPVSVSVSPNPAPVIAGPNSTCPGGTVMLDAGPGFASYAWSTGATTQSITVTPTATTTYGVTVLNGGGCSATASQTVSVTTAPAATITAPPNVCPSSSGNSATTATTPGATYAWTISGGTITAGQGTNSITFSAAASGSVQLAVIVTSGSCSATGNASVAISAVSGTAAISAPSSVIAGSSGNSASVTPVSGATYSWTISGGAITAGQGTPSITWTAGTGAFVTINVSVTTGGCSATGSHSVTVSGTADLSVSISAPASVQTGAPFAYVVTVANAGPSAAQSVAVTDALPAGVAFQSASGGGWTCTNNGNSVACSASSVVPGTATPITIAVTAPSSPTSITDAASVASPTTDPKSGNNTATVTTQVTAPTPQCGTTPPSLTSPADGATALQNPITFSWTAVANASAYDLWVNGNVATSAGGTSATLSLPAGTATWQVVARFGNGCTPLTSASRSFTVAQAANCNHAGPQLVAPAPAAVVSSPVGFQWTAVPEAVNYRVWVAIDAGALQDVGTTNGAINFSAPITGTNVTWYVEALFNGCASTSSATSTFSIAPVDPCANHATATLVAPADKATSSSSSIQFQWNAVANASGYRVWTKVNAGSANAAGETSSDTTLSTTIASGSVEWYVQTLFDGCPSTESAHFTFTVPPAQNCPTAAATLVAPANGSTQTSTSAQFSWNAAPGAIGYEVWLSLSAAAPSLLGSTTATTFTHEVPAGALEWFVRTNFNGCPSIDSAHATFTVAPPPSCTQQRPLLTSPADDDHVVSPASFTWSAVPSATQYKVWTSRAHATPTVLGTTTANHLDAQTLQPGEYEWFVEADFGNGCAATTSVSGNFIAVAPPPPCAAPVAPAPRADSQISSDVGYVISWNRIGNAAFYEYEESPSADFNGATPLAIYTDRVSFKHANTTPSAVPYFFRVRMVSQCDNARSLFSPTVVVIILPAVQTGSQANGSTPADDPQNVTYTLNVPAQAGQTFSATANEPWLTVAPSSGTATSNVITLTVTAATTGLGLGTNSGAITVVLGNTSASGGLATNGSTTTSTTVNVSLVSPSAPTNKSTPPPDALIIPAVAHADGINSHFQSDIRLTNTAPSVKKYQLTFTPSGDAGLQQGKQATVTVDPGRTIALDDILSSWFGQQGAIGTLEIRPSSTTQSATSPGSPSPSNGVPSITTFAASRTYNTTSNGTFGQFIPAIPFAQFVGAKDSILTLQQIAQSTAYRTNVGLVEGAGEPATVLLSIFGDDGSKLGEFTQSLTAGEHVQLNGLLAAHNLSASDGRIEVKVTSATGKVTAYASVVDNNTNDPLLVSPVQVNSLGAQKWVIPGVADLSNGLANWRSDVRLYNAGAKPVNATLTYVPQGDGATITKTVAIAPNQVQQLDGILQNLFGVTNSGGALQITTADNAPLVATARTYNQTSNGTYGQFIPAVTPADAVGKGERALQLLEVEESDRYRSNIGIAEVTGNAATVEITAVPPDSKTAVTTTTTLNANEFRQYGSLLRSLGLGDTYNARVSVRVLDGSGRVTAYASVIDQKTQDPTFVPAQ